MCRRPAWFSATLLLLAALAGSCQDRTVSAADEAPAAATSTAPADVVPANETASPEPRPAAAPTTQLPRRLVDRSDLPGILGQRRLRVLVPYARPFFFIDGAEPNGITYEAFREFGAFVEEAQGLRSGDLEIVYMPCELEVVIPWLKAGYGDVAAAALTVTPERQGEVAFTDPLIKDVAEIVVTARGAAPLTSLDDLAGREVWVTAASSYVGHLRSLSERLVAHGLAPLEIVEAPGTLSTEDLFEMIHAGIVELTVSDSYKATLWSQVLADLVPRADLVVHSGGSIAWAVRKNNPALLARLNDFVAQARKGTLLGNILIKRYLGSTRWIENPVDAEGQARVRRYAPIMQELAEEYAFDWLRIAAQCFQESGLDPRAKSRSGALGLMQLLPSTAADMGCDDPYDPEENLRAGVKYLDWLRTNFFSDPELGEVARMDLILAAYNAGPGNVRKWRRQAPERGLDPNLWRENIERIALEAVGVQPIRYVDNIEKFYVAYSLSLELRAGRERDLEELRQGE